ncbi:uncharacterized protein SCHCODRAFT_02640276 [Schizophyllum commune H4-8]|uniref:uncharacterized protein n=1 Tax=Schizophyllum commune (strain H4-8 / FGSC 9210) TaxID=578458 RepID=UPI00215ED501|nr:uncharacterized protein SCHCODRAFT_02640276 [Schizophyllum commune H4-8]KAI5886915.1 hypothetical protein SCHCODRAFT_02640276 [Schizophyllum commune H4-8]
MCLRVGGSLVVYFTPRSDLLATTLRSASSRAGPPSGTLGTAVNDAQDRHRRRLGPPSPTLAVLVFTTRQQRIPPHVTFGIGFPLAFYDASLLIFDDASLLIFDDAFRLILEDAFLLAFDDESRLHPQQRIPPHRLLSALVNVANKHVERDLANNGGGGSCPTARHVGLENALSVRRNSLLQDRQTCSKSASEGGVAGKALDEKTGGSVW